MSAPGDGQRGALAGRHARPRVGVCGAVGWPESGVQDATLSARRTVRADGTETDPWPAG